MLRAKLLFSISVLLVLGMSVPAAAQWPETFKLTASDGAGADWFSRSVAISGNTAIVGAWGNDDAGTNSGSAYLFDVTTGSELFKLTSSDAAEHDNFG